MPEPTNPSFELSVAFQAHLYTYLGIEAVEAVRTHINENVGQASIPEYTYGKLNCILDIHWKQTGDQFFFLAQIKPSDEEITIGEAYPFMQPPVLPDATIPEIGTEDVKEVFLHALQVKKMQWVYVYNSHPEKSPEYDAWLDELSSSLSPSLPGQLASSENLSKLSHSVVDSLSKDGWHGGLYFSGNLGLDFIPNWEEFKTYFGLANFDPKVDFYGLVHYPQYFPQVTLHLPLVSNLGSGPLKLEEVYLEMSSPTYYVPRQTEIGFGANLKIAGEELKIKAVWPIGSDKIKAKATVSGHLPFVDTSTVPGLRDFSPTAEIDLEMDLSISEKSITRIKFNLEVENWVIIDKILTLEELDFSLTVLDPGTFNLVMGTVHANALLGSSGIRLSAQGEYPSEQFSFRLDQNTPIHINQLLSSFSGKHPALDDGLVIDQFEGWVNARTGFASFSTGVSGAWRPGIMDIELKDLHFNISKSETWSFAVWANFSLHNVAFEVSALYNDGWIFAAKANEVLFSEFFKAISNGESLPSSLKSLTASDFLFEYSTKNKDYKFGGKE
jgi:hypothetical protein